MFNFKKKTLNPALAAILEKMNAALALPDAAEKAEQLLTVKEESESTLGRIANSEQQEGVIVYIMGAVLCAAVAAISGGVLAMSFLPFGVVAYTLLALGLLGFSGMFKNASTASNSKAIITGKIDQEIVTLSKTHREDVLKAFGLHAAKAAFNAESAHQQKTDADFTKLKAQVAPKAATPA